MAFDTDVVIIGAGAVGLAIARATARRGHETIVIERERNIGQGVSARNSEVVHAGIYYPTRSLKAHLCVAGRRMLYAYMDKHQIPYERCGKLVVATGNEEATRLDAILAQGEANGVVDLQRLTGEEARALEPELNATAAILSPSSGVMASHAYMSALAGEITAHGGAIAINTPFEGASLIEGGGFVIRTGGDAATEVTTRHLIIAAGLGAQGAASRIETYPEDGIPALHYGKGVYFSAPGAAPFKHLVYPLPIPGALGTHYRRDLGGQARFGPDLEYVDTLDYAVDPARALEFYATIRRFWPGLPDDALVPDYSGIRPKLHGPGEPQCDFRILGPDSHGLAGLVTLFGIESPGLTSSLAIGELVLKRLGLRNDG
jgi:L-2-hydroxyglutarate oxidase LhgO